MDLCNILLCQEYILSETRLYWYYSKIQRWGDDIEFEKGYLTSCIGKSEVNRKYLTIEDMKEWDWETFKEFLSCYHSRDEMVDGSTVSVEKVIIWVRLVDIVNLW